MANPDYGDADEARIADTNALIASYEASADYPQLWARYVLVEQRMNSENLMGRFAESDRIRAEMNRISRTVGKRIGAEALAMAHAQNAAAVASRKNPNQEAA